MLRPAGTLLYRMGPGYLSHFILILTTIFSFRVFIIQYIIDVKEVNKLNIFDKITEKMEKFMRGRNGLDELTILLIYLSTFVSYIPGMEWLMAVSFALYLLSVYRTLSGNTYSRRMEFNIYLKYKNRVLRNIRLMKRKYADRKTHRYYRCRICGCVMRVPKFKGKIEITCPQCRNSIIKKR